MRVQIEIHVLHRKQGDGHVIALFHLFLEDQVIAQDTRQYLQQKMIAMFPQAQWIELPKMEI